MLAPLCIMNAVRHALLGALYVAAVWPTACPPERDEASGQKASRSQYNMTSTADSLSLELVATSPVRFGEKVRFTLRAQNLSGRRLDLYLRGRISLFDVVVRRDKEVVWQRLEGEIIPAIVHVKTVAPKERWELSAEWDQRTKDGTAVGAGEYSAQGLLLVEGEPLATPVAPLRIVER